MRRVYETGEVEFAIHEAFYDIGGKAGVSITTEAVPAHAESVEGMLKSLEKPVLDWETQKEI